MLTWSVEFSSYARDNTLREGVIQTKGVANGKYLLPN